MNDVNWAYVLWLLFQTANCHKLLLIFPFPGKSHGILAEGYVKRLLEGGHELTYVTAFPMNYDHPRLQQIDVSSNHKLLPMEESLEFGKFIENQKSWSLSVLHDMLNIIAEGTIFHANVQTLMMDRSARFDAVLVEWLHSELYAGFAPIFKCPLIWTSTMEVHGMVLSLIDQYTYPAYTPDHMSITIPPYNLWGRTEQLWRWLHQNYELWMRQDMFRKAYEKAFGPSAAKRGVTLPSYEEAKHNGSIVLGNSHISLGLPVRLPQNYIPIGGYHIDDVIPSLPEKLQNIMDNAQHGVIYFSMGSMLKSRTLPREWREGLLNIFGSLKQTVIWKFEEPMSNLPANVHIVQWAPQWSILAHPNCAVFVNHGGFLSTTEAVHFGVPIIGIPTFVDQFNNINRAVLKGYAKRVDLSDNLPQDLLLAIQDITKDSRYSDKAKEYSLIYHHRPVPPGELMLRWIDLVIRTNGARFLRSLALDIPLYQMLYLDLIAVVFAVIIVFQAIIKIIFKNSVDKKKVE